jgi:hypothetical protein
MAGLTQFKGDDDTLSNGPGQVQPSQPKNQGGKVLSGPDTEDGTPSESFGTSSTFNPVSRQVPAGGGVTSPKGEDE